MKLASGDEVEFTVHNGITPKIQLHVDDGWEGISSFMTVEEACKLRTTLTRCIREAKLNIHNDIVAQHLNTSGAYTGRVHYEEH